MTHERDLDRVLDRWMDDGPTVVSDRVIATAMTDVHTTRQRGGPRLPWRTFAMITRTTHPPRWAVTPLAGGLFVLFLALAGAYLMVKPNIGFGPTPSPHDADDIGAIVEAPATLTGRLVEGEVPPSSKNIVSGSAYEALHIPLVSSPIHTSGDPTDDAVRASLMSSMYTGLEAAQTRFYDAIGASGNPLPATEPGGASVTVTAATYADAAAAEEAFDAFVASYATWEFDAQEAWSQADEGVAFGPSMMDRPHARCRVLASVEPCETALRVWRDANLVVTVIHEGSDAVSLDEVVSVLDAAPPRD